MDGLQSGQVFTRSTVTRADKATDSDREPERATDTGRSGTEVERLLVDASLQDGLCQPGSVVIAVIVGSRDNPAIRFENRSGSSLLA